MGYVYYGSGSNALVAGAAPGSHVLQGWGGVQAYTFPIQASISANQALTTELASWVVPFPYVYIWNVVLNVTASGTGAGHSVSIYNTHAAGTSSNLTPALSATIPIAASLAASTTIDARFANPAQYVASADPLIAQGTNLQQWANKYMLPRGTILSLRAATPASTGSLTNLLATILYAAFNAIPEG